MSLAVRVIPTILSHNLKLVKGEAFDSSRVVGHALQSARIHSARGVDELIILDVAATPNRRDPDYRMVEELTETCFIPVTIGGGIRTLDHVKTLLRAGADKVSIGTKAAENSCFISELAREYGSQAIVVSVDVKASMVWTHCGKTCRGIDPVTFSRQMEHAGAGEILLSSIERDGKMCGYDLDLISDVASAVSIPVIASGGCSGYDDMVKAIQAGASAVACGALYQFTDSTPAEAAQYLCRSGIEARV